MLPRAGLNLLEYGGRGSNEWVSYGIGGYRDICTNDRGSFRRMITEEQIRELAHSIWEQKRRPHGKDIEHQSSS